MNGTSGLTASDILALTNGNNNGGFLTGNTGGILAIIIVFILLFGGNGFWGNNNSTTNALALSDINMAQYFQTQDNALRNLAQNQCNIIDSALNNKYDNAILIKDLSNQMSNSVASLGNMIQNQTATITQLFNEQTIDHLREVNTNLRDSLSNANQTAIITNAINSQTNEILNAQGRYYLNPPCYQSCGGCCNGLY